MVLLGDTGVGKSSIVLRFITNEFKPYVESTIGASFMSKLVLDADGSPIKFQIWDTAGQEGTEHSAESTMPTAQCALTASTCAPRQTTTGSARSPTRKRMFSSSASASSRAPPSRTPSPSGSPN